MSEYDFLRLPFLAGCLVLATHLWLGREVLRRGIVFLDLAVAQIAALGVVAAHSLGFESGWGVQACALLAAMLGALVVWWIERRWPEIQEALIGSLFVTAASVGVLLLAHDPHGIETLHDLLAGQLLWVTQSQVVWLALASVVIVGLQLAGLGRSSIGFYLLFAGAVVASVQMVGVYLVFASLILPALASRQYAGGWAIVIGGAVGALAYAIGLGLSAWLDWPAGATIVCTLAAISVLARFVSCFTSRERLGVK